MFKKFSVFCILLLAFSIVFRGFSALETGSGSESGSGYMVAPSVVFTKWRIGRSAQGTNINSKEHRSFITSTGTSCGFEASVRYKKGNLPKDAFSPIDPKTVVWSVFDGNQGIHSISIQHNWSGLHPEKLSGSTSFNVVGKLKVDEYKVTAKPELCRDENNDRRHERTPLHRDNTKLAFKIKFWAQTKAGQTVSVVLPLEAIEEDQIRQEYVDLNKPIPSRDDLTGENTYDFGHYKKMLYSGLDDHFQDWVDAMNGIYRQGKPALQKSDFLLNSGYRNPHYNYHHSGSSATLSPHMYGYALDVDGKDIDDVPGADHQKMVNAAKRLKTEGGAGARHSQKYKNRSHVHADWAPSDWYPRSLDNTRNNAGPPPTFSLPPAGTDTVACDKKTENNCTVMVSSSSEHYVTCPNSQCGDSYWSCDSDDYDEHRLRTCTWEKLPNGKVCGGSWRSCQYSPERISGTNLSIRSPLCPTDPNNTRHCAERNSDTAPSGGDNPNTGGNAPITPAMHACGTHTTSVSGNHSLQASCSQTDSYGQGCTVTNFYACQTHTHQYPALVSGACGHTYASGSASSHALQASCSSTNANGDSCTVTSFYNCQSHTHQYPAPSVTCVNGHSYDPENSDAVSLHITRTCRYCSQSWQKCVSSTPFCTVPWRVQRGLKCWGINE